MKLTEYPLSNSLRILRDQTIQKTQMYSTPRPCAAACCMQVAGQATAVVPLLRCAADGVPGYRGMRMDRGSNSVHPSSNVPASSAYSSQAGNCGSRDTCDARVEQ